jgi:hypothetical protein
LRELESLLDALKVLVGNFPATAHKDTEILLGTPSTDGLGVALDPPGGGGHASRFGFSHSGLLLDKRGAHGSHWNFLIDRISRISLRGCRESEVLGCSIRETRSGLGGCNPPGPFAFYAHYTTRESLRTLSTPAKKALLRS